jgi:hypothetical protein
MPTRHRPKGRNGTWKTGQRVPATGLYSDQYGYVSHHDFGGTFPPCIGRPKECAFRLPFVAATTTKRV